MTSPMSIASLLEPPEPFSALIFDLDGTLAETLPAHYQAWVEALQSAGVALTPEYFHQLSGSSSVEIVRALNRDYSYELDPDAISMDKERRYGGKISSVKEARAVADIARRYSGIIPLAVASGTGRELVDATLEVIGLRSLFQTVVTADDVTRHKPAPDLFLLTAKRLGVPPADCIVYEDGDVGLEAAARAGMRCIDVRESWAERPRLL